MFMTQFLVPLQLFSYFLARKISGYWQWIKNGGYVEEEVQCINILTQLIPHRLIDNNIFDNFLNKLDITFNKKIRFTLTSTLMIQRRNIEFAKQFLHSINDKNPLIVRHGITKEGDVCFYLIYSPKYFSDLLSKPSLDVEKYVMHQILTQLCYYFKVKNPQHRVTECMTKLFDNTKTAFLFTSASSGVIRSLKIDYPHTLESDIAEITRITAEFLTKIDISPDVYEKEQAKEILHKTYDFLNKKFIEKIKDMDQKMLLQFLSHFEGEIIKDRMLHQKRSKNELQFKMEYDSLAEYSKKNIELSILGNVYRYAIEICMKHGGKGTELLSLENWLELQAMAEQILTCSILASYLHFGLGEFKFTVFDDYSFSVEPINSSALEKFSTSFDKMFVSTEKPTINSHTTKSRDQFIDELDEPFMDEFGITFRKFIDIVGICLAYLQDHNETMLVKIDELCSFGKSHYPELTIEEIATGLEILSLTKENMNHEFYPSDARNRPYRYDCKPILKFNEHEYLMNILTLDNTWAGLWAEIDQGYLPYNDNNIGPNLLSHLHKLREHANKSHEQAVYKIFKDKTEMIELNLKKSNQMLSNIDEELPGEIDLLVFFENRKEIYIIEAKNIKMNYAARDMSNEIKSFTKNNGYIEKFQRKINYIRNHLSEILDYYQISDKEGWKFNNFFVTLNVSFPQETSTEYQFITLVELSEKISML